jgi:hypothetical protein
MPLATLDARFAAVIDRLCRAVAARSAGGRLAGPLIVLIWARLRRMARRFASLVVRHAAGRPLAHRPPARQVARRRSAPPWRWPRGNAWLVRLVPEAASGGALLSHLLAEPEMAEFVAAAPQAGRILRPLCRMLGITPPGRLRRAPPAGPLPASAPPVPARTGPPPPQPSPHQAGPVPASALPRGGCGPPPLAVA